MNDEITKNHYDHNERNQITKTLMIIMNEEIIYKNYKRPYDNNVRRNYKRPLW